jgi:glycosyltransferase involved in cell wall biosynthesis
LRLSIVLIVYNMQRAAPRSVQSLAAAYQRDIASDDYEIIVVENGSTAPLDEQAILALGDNIQYHYLSEAPPSPARAINHGVSLASGDVLAIMVDGAHMLTPGALSFALQPFACMVNPVVVTLPFFLGPGPQMETVLEGYDEAAEDALLAGIGWPGDGYRLFEIGVPYRIEPGGIRPKLLWMVRQFESNCLFMRRAAFLAVGGCDERFDIPGGGALIPDLYLRLSRLQDSELVQLIGEASFHQIHGGTSTNVSRADQKQLWQRYLDQYQEIRGEPFQVSKKPLKFFGHFPHPQVRELLITG